MGAASWPTPTEPPPDRQPVRDAPASGGDVMVATVVEQVPVRVQMPSRAEFAEVFELRWHAAAPQRATLAVGRHPDTREPVLWWFDLDLLAEGLRQPVEDMTGGMLAEPEVNDPRWLLLAQTEPGTEVAVLLLVSRVERFLYRVAEAQAAAVDLDALTDRLLGRARGTAGTTRSRPASFAPRTSRHGWTPCPPHRRTTQTRSPTARPAGNRTTPTEPSRPERKHPMTTHPALRRRSQPGAARQRGSTGKGRTR